MVRASAACDTRDGSAPTRAGTSRASGSSACPAPVEVVPRGTRERLRAEFTSELLDRLLRGGWDMQPGRRPTDVQVDPRLAATCRDGRSDERAGSTREPTRQRGEHR
ncbi:hypothetical protein [Saccharothrix yanglingensis]|uniref:hypothetical protein n=1 Tax=Saccharothrix yanglingensis TaxID=659496 RepID=UPI0027D2ABF8|nr:hypothetical protein [Saccharothrix yanglingensis]